MLLNAFLSINASSSNPDFFLSRTLSTIACWISLSDTFSSRTIANRFVPVCAYRQLSSSPCGVNLIRSQELQSDLEYAGMIHTVCFPFIVYFSDEDPSATNFCSDGNSPAIISAISVAGI